MGRSNKNKGTENQQQQRDDANDDAIASGSHMEASGEHTIGTQLSEAPTVADIMSAINNLSQNVDKRFDSLQTSIADFNQTMADVERRLSKTESGLNEHETRIKALEDRCARWEGTAQTLSERLDDLVSRSRSQNIQIIGVKEGSEKGNPTDFVAKLIPMILGEENFDNKPVKVDRVLRVRGRVTAADAPPRQIIARIHHDTVKERILRLSLTEIPTKIRGRTPTHLSGSRPSCNETTVAVRRHQSSVQSSRTEMRLPISSDVGGVGRLRQAHIHHDKFLDDNRIPRQTCTPGKGVGNN